MDIFTVSCVYPIENLGYCDGEKRGAPATELLENDFEIYN